MRIVVCGLLLVLSMILTWQAFQISGPAGLYPIVVTLGASIVLACYMIMQVVRQGADMPETTQVERQTTQADVFRIIGFTATWILYVVVLPFLGFFASTWVALFVSLVLSFGRASVQSVIGTGLFTLILAILMKTVLYVPVPQGWVDIRLDVLIYRSF